MFSQGILHCSNFFHKTKVWNFGYFFNNGRNFHLFRSTYNYSKASSKEEEKIQEGSFGIYRNLNDSSILISGISGRFPLSNSMDEFKKNLLEGKDLLSEQNRFKVGKTLPPRYGFIDNLDKFDADFFGVSDKMAQIMDPALRILLEVTFEALLDAGINPESLKGSRTGVFVGSEGADAGIYWNLKHGKSVYDGYTALGSPSFMQANQLSHLFDLRGTSLTLSTACSSSLHALERAVHAIITGKCERAIVAATTLHLISHQSNDLNILGALSPTGECKPFDSSANGFVRGEAVVSIIIEKEEVAKRRYAKIKGIRTSTDGFKKEGIFHPSGAAQEALYNKLYKESNVDPGSVVYIETHGNGTQTGDPQELKGISEAFCKTFTRTEPLLIGSVKSNMGHGEAAAGLCSIAKILIASQEGIIPRTLHFKEANKSLAEFFDGSLKLVTENTPFPGGIVGVSAFGIGGTNSHLILETNSKQTSSFTKNKSKITNLKPNLSAFDPLPVLIPFSGREEEPLRQSLNQACDLAQNSNFAGIVHEVFKQRVTNHPFRGYGIVSLLKDSAEDSSNDVPKTVVNIKKNESQETRPIWFVFSGMGSQWQGMGKDLIKIDAFQESFKTSRATLKNVGVDTDSLLLPKNTSIFENIRDAYNTIAVMQIALYDTLKSINIEPQGYFGHSFGEILCAYADGSLTAEEALRIVDARGRAMVEGAKKDSPGAMAAVGLSWSEIQNRCQSGSNPEIFPACHNGPQNVTVSGKESAINVFVKQLQSEGIFAKNVNSCGVAAHSPFILPASTLYSSYLQEIFKGRTEREKSNRWISTSIPESQWDSNLAKNVSPENFLNNFVSPVLFHEAISHVPKNAILVEISPTGLLQGALKASLPETCSIIAPMQKKKNHSNDGLLHFLTSIGDIHNAGAEVDISKLYPPVNFPVNAQTPSVSSLVEWKHDRSWIVPIIENTEKYTEGILNIDLEDSAFSYLDGHKLEDRLVFPATGYLVFAWKSLAASLGCNYEDLPVTFTNVHFERAVFLNRKKPTQLRCSFHPGRETFEITENGSTVTKGSISSTKAMPDFSSKFKELVIQNEDRNKLHMNSKDIYKELRLRGYNFNKDFQSIRRMDLEGSWAEVYWKENWVTLLDSILQSSVLSKCHFRATYVPVKITSLALNPKELYNYIQSGKEYLPVRNQIYSSRTLAPGIELSLPISQSIPMRDSSGNLAISKYSFTPYIQKGTASNMESATSSGSESTPLLHSSLATMVDIYLENCSKKHIKIYDTFHKLENSLAPEITRIFSAKPLQNKTIISMSTETEIRKIESSKQNVFSQNVVQKTSMAECIPEHLDADLAIIDDAMLLKPVSKVIQNHAWIILQDSMEKISHSKYCSDGNVQLIARSSFDGNNLLLFKKVQLIEPNCIETLSIDQEEYKWLPKLKNLLSHNSNSPTSRIYICSQNNPTSGIIGLIKCLQQEPNGDKLRCIFDPDGKLILNFQDPNPILSDILHKDLVMNIFQNGIHGSYRHIPIPKEILERPTKLVNHAKVISTKIGDLSSLKWVESPLKYFKEEKIVNVNYAAINFRDIMIASARLPFLNIGEDNDNPLENNLGFEFSGTDNDGNRLMGIGPKNSIATSVLVGNNQLVWKVPEEWSLEEAATIPIVYGTAYYSLLIRGSLEPEQSILIHSGTGAVGQAAINLALSMNCNVFTTVGTEEKRKHILQLFPLLKEENISSSRNCKFEQSVLELTNGRGVDYVLNSLSEDKLHASIRCLASGGTFLEIGKFDIIKDAPLGLRNLMRNINFFAIDLKALLVKDHEKMPLVHKLVEEGIKIGVVKPLERTLFNKDQIENAFRYMAAGNHIGKVLIQVKKEDENAANKNPAAIKAIPKTYFDQEKTYLIVGGLGGLGLELADWMIQRGAKHLILTSRSGVTNGYQQLCLNRFEKSGVKVETPKIDLSVYDTAKIFLEDFIKEGKVLGGFFNSGLVLKNYLLENQTEEMFKEVAKPKIKVTENMDKLTREFCKDHLDYFVTFSSLSAGLGNAGQSNYGFANSAMEQICLQRRKDGLHAASIQWGVIGDVGYVAENMKDGDQVFDGMLPQKVSSCLEVLDVFLQQSKMNSLDDVNNTCFSSMIIQDDHIGSSRMASKATLLESVARLCGIKTQSQQLHDINPFSKLNDLGLDSLSGTELQQLLYREYNTPLTPVEVRQLTWGDLQKIEAEKNQFKAEKRGEKEQKEKQQEISGNKVAIAEARENKKILVKLSSKKDAKDDDIPLFIVHGSEGLAFPFLPLAKKLDCAVYAFEAEEKYSGKEVTVPRIDEFAKQYLKEIKSVQQEGPYNLAGYSAGASIACVIAQQLEKDYKEKVNLILLDGYCCFGHEEKIYMQNSLKFMLEMFRESLNLTEEEKMDLLDKLSSLDVSKGRQKLQEWFEAKLEKENDAQKLKMLKSIKSSFYTMTTMGDMLGQFKPTSQFEGNVSLIKAQDSFLYRSDEFTNFEKFCEKQVIPNTVPGDHYSFLHEANAQETANAINKILKKT